MDMNGVVSAVFDAANGQLSVTVLGSASTAGDTVGKKDENGVWDAVFDRSTNTLRVVTV